MRAEGFALVAVLLTAEALALAPCRVTGRGRGLTVSVRAEGVDPFRVHLLGANVILDLDPTRADASATVLSGLSLRARSVAGARPVSRDPRRR